MNTLEINCLKCGKEVIIENSYIMDGNELYNIYCPYCMNEYLISAELFFLP